MEDDSQDGPLTVWQMFNAPTMVLFNNLEHAEDGLDRLLTSILKLSGYVCNLSQFCCLNTFTKLCFYIINLYK